MELSIAEVARTAGTTSRTLRHYDDVGLLPPTRVGANGYRYYDEAALRQSFTSRPWADRIVDGVLYEGGDRAC